jgi:hypothetical protein
VPALKLGDPRPLFQPKSAILGYDISPDGRRFLVATPTEKAPQTTVVLNWTSSLRDN